MFTRRWTAVLAAAGCLAALGGHRASGADPTVPAASPIDQVASRLPPEVGDAARRWLTGDPKELRALLAFSPAVLEQAVMVALASEAPAADFVLHRMPSETAETDRLILRVIVVDAFWADQPGVVDAVQKLAEAATDPDLMLAYLDGARRLEAKHLRETLTARIADVRRGGDEKELGTLAAADDRWVIEERGAMMPGFMRRPPPVFSIKPSDQPIRLIGMGDFGSGTQAQREVAAAIVRMGKSAPFDFGLTFGDNFYPSGMEGPDDSRWRDWWEALYGPLGITFYPSLGNHEWYSDDGAVSEVAYRSATWRFPAPFYSFTAGPVQFFALDTTEISEEEILWLDQTLKASTSRWKVVYGHHPIFAPERDARSGLYLKYMQGRLWPVIRGRVDAYLCGHQHAMAHMGAREGVHFFMSGGGGAPLSKVNPKVPGALFAESTFGFLTLEANSQKMTIAIFDTDGKAFDSEIVTK
ncbi:MAG TPA: metallophosphoesterase [Opitutaceae bacterium]